MSIKEDLKKAGYIAGDSLSKKVELFKIAGERNSKNIPTMILTGEPGAGKTYLAETFTKLVNAQLLFLQCFPGMGAENLIAEPNLSAIIKNDGDNAISDGLLVKALKTSNEKPVVVVIDEIDKATFEVDSFLLDFLNSGRVSNGQEIWVKGSYPIWVFITSNKQRELSEALNNRGRQVYVKRPTLNEFMNILNLPKNHHLAMVYKHFPDFSIRQAKEYLADIELFGGERDIDILSQYVDTSRVKVTSLEEANLFGMDISFEPNFLKVKVDNEHLVNYIREHRNEVNITSGESGLELVIKTLDDANAIQHLIEFPDGQWDVIVSNELITSEILAGDVYEGKQAGLFVIYGECLVGYKIDGKTYVTIDSNSLDKLDGSTMSF